MDFPPEVAAQVRRLEVLYQAAQKIGTMHPDSAAAAQIRAEFDAELALLQIKTAERIAETAQRSSDSLARATWVLALMTVVLAAASVALIFVTLAVN